MNSRPSVVVLRIRLLVLALITIAAGLALRKLPLGLPFPVVKWGGSVLWAAMVYFLLTAVLPRRSPSVVATIAAVLAALVELSRLYHSPALDAFRLTPAGILLLGRVFDPWHFAVYWTTIALTAFADAKILRHNLRESTLS
jgi:hypothetical protein